MAGCIVQAWLSRDAMASWDRAEFILVETQSRDFAGVMLGLQTEGFISGSKLLTHPAEERGVRVVHGRSPVYLGKAAVVRLELPSWRFEEGEARG